MKPIRALQALAVTGIAAACLSGLAACSGANASGGVAATVNGNEIQEQTITDYVENFRSTQGLDTDDAWGQWMASYGLTPETVREQVIDYFVDEELTKEAAAENDVEVTDEEVDEQVEAMKANYASDDAWQSALTSAGTTEDQYRDSVRNAMLEQRLEEKVVSDVEEPSDDEMLSYVQLYAPAFDGAKRSSHILFSSDDEDTAQQVLDQINNGEISFEDAAKQYSTDTATAENGGDVGWDMLNNFVTEYSEALANLDEGQVSGLVESDYGIHIIKCTEVFHAPDEVTSIDQVPSELVDYIEDMVISSNESNAYAEWQQDYKDNADITINDMPEGLPYDIDMSKYTSEDSSSEDTVATEESGTDSSEATDAESSDSSDESSEDADSASADQEASDDGTTQPAEGDVSSDADSDSGSGE